jgi:4-hydroxythreonine-4-phosphate dehydrogenase
MPRIAITAGEPAGIGPELCAMLAERQARAPFPARLVVFGDLALLRERAARIGLAPRYVPYAAGVRAVSTGSAAPTPSSASTAPATEDAARAPPDGAVEVLDLPLAAACQPGRPDPANAPGVMAMLAAACDGCADGSFDALVTAPVQKSLLLDAGYPFTGHTEFFAERTGTPRVVMMLVSDASPRALRVALVTTHLPLRAVPDAITQEGVVETLAIAHADLVRKFGIARPRIGVCGLNPHAGEGGHLGREEIDVIAPAIAKVRARGLDVSGPLPADTIFVPAHARGFDAIVAMYHDQGLPVLKSVGFGHGVNVTLGLPFVRTSVDHGTALDLAADAARAATADPGSLFEAVELAVALAA